MSDVTNISIEANSTSYINDFDEIDPVVAFFTSNESRNDPFFVINLLHKRRCRQYTIPCEERHLFEILNGYGFILIFLLALFGNIVNLLIYNSDHIKYYIAIRMLCTRLLINSLTLLCMLPRALRIVSVWTRGSQIDHHYWRFYPYQLYVVNVFGFCSMWLTVMMIAECYLHVFFPSHSKLLFTKRNLSRCYLIMMTVGACLYVLSFFNRSYTISQQCDRITVQINAPNDIFMKTLERFHTFVNLLLAIIIPVGLLVFMAISILWKLVLRKTEFTTHFTNEKRCVTRITLITTALQLIAELPYIPVFIYATFSGPDVTNGHLMCIWNTIGSFLGVCNISLSFFVYIVFSDKFRKMVYTRFSDLFRPLIIAITMATSASGGPSNVKVENDSVDMRETLMSSRSSQKPSQAEPESFCTDTYLLNERSSTNGDDSYL